MNADYRGEERRRYSRLKVNFLVIYNVRQPVEIIMVVGDKLKTALMSDLSETGMAILTNFNIPISTILQIKFTLINTGARDDKRIKTMEMSGEVRNNTVTDKKIHRLGILFKHINEQDKKSIADFVKETNR